MPISHAPIEERQRRVGELVMERRTQAEIAEAIGCSPRTVAKDIKALRAEWQAERVTDTDTWIGEELAKLQRAETALWPQIDRGGYLAVDRLIAIMDRRAKYLGLDAPVKTQETVDVDDLRARLYARIVAVTEPAETTRISGELIGPQ